MAIRHLYKNMKYKYEGQKPFKVKKSDKLILIIDSHQGIKSQRNMIAHEIVRIDFKEQLNYFSKFLENFILDKEKIKTIISRCKYDLKSKDKYNNTFSSWRINDKLANVDFMEYQEIGKLYIFMVVSYKKKPKTWWAENYFKN